MRNKYPLVINPKYTPSYLLILKNFKWPILYITTLLKIKVKKLTKEQLFANFSLKLLVPWGFQIMKLGDFYSKIFQKLKPMVFLKNSKNDLTLIKFKPFKWIHCFEFANTFYWPKCKAIMLHQFCSFTFRVLWVKSGWYLSLN
jgi:hypothetical protein